MAKRKPHQLPKRKYRRLERSKRQILTDLNYLPTSFLHLLRELRQGILSHTYDECWKSPDNLLHTFDEYCKSVDSPKLQRHGEPKWRDMHRECHELRNEFRKWSAALGGVPCTLLQRCDLLGGKKWKVIAARLEELRDNLNGWLKNFSLLDLRHFSWFGSWERKKSIGLNAH